MTDRNKKNKSYGGIFTKETLSVTLVAFSAIIMLIVATRNALFGKIGDAISATMLGVFGFMFYPVFSCVIIKSVLSLSGKKIKLPVITKIGAFIAVISGALIAHTAMSSSQIGETFSSYVSFCFNAADKASSSATFFGVIGALPVYPLVSGLSATGTYVVLSLFAALGVYFIVCGIRKNSSSSKKANEDYDADDESIDEEPINKKLNAGRTYPVSVNYDEIRMRLGRNRQVGARAGQESNPPVNQVNGYKNAEGAYQTPVYADNFVPANEIVHIAPSEVASDNGVYPVGVQTNGGIVSRNYGTNAVSEQNGQTLSRMPYDDDFSERERVRNILFNKNDNAYEKNLIYNKDSNYNRLHAVEKPSIPSSGASAVVREEKSPDVVEARAQIRGLTEQKKSYTNGAYYLMEENSSDSYQDDYEKEKDIFSNFTRNARIVPDIPEPKSEVNNPEPETSISPRQAVDALREDTPVVEEEPAPIDNNKSVDLENSKRRIDAFSCSPRTPRAERARPAFDADDVEEAISSSDKDRIFDEFDEAEADYEEEEMKVIDEYEDDKNEFTGNERKITYEEEIKSKASAARGIGMYGKSDFTVHKEYAHPPLTLFKNYPMSSDDNKEEIEENKRTIVKTLNALIRVQVEVVGVTSGPTFTRYDVRIPPHVPSRRVMGLATDIALALHSSDGVNIFPNLKNGTTAIEVPNKKRFTVGLLPLLEDKEFINAPEESLMFAIGKDIEGKNIYGNIAKMVHILVAGATGAGKSVFLNSLILSLITKYTPEQLRLILIDPKQVEFSVFYHLPHLMLDEIVSEPVKVIAVLNWAIDEMERRYELFDQMRLAGRLVKNINEFNEFANEGEKLPKIVIIMDELADLISKNKNEIEDKVSRLTAKSRACGIHIIIATQRPSVNIITGVIKANLPTRIAFKVASDIDSRTILDEQGAEKLLGNGDLLYKTNNMFSPMRVQGAFVSSSEVQDVVEYIKNNNEAYYDTAVSELINKKMDESNTDSEESISDNNEVEPLFIDALRVVIQEGVASISMIQRKFAVGYNKAGRIIEWMASNGYISSFDNAKSRKVIITQEEFDKIYG